MGLQYIGNGAFCPPYPARNLSDQEVETFGKEALLKTGLYAEEPEKKPAAKSKPVKEGE